jgi:monothiol glutaredoxin
MGLIMAFATVISKEIAASDVVLFMKGTADAPQCGFSQRVVQILDHMNVTYRDINVLSSVELRSGIKEYSNWPTIPQLYVRGEFVGGCDIVNEMFLTGELAALFDGSNVSKTDAASV